MTVFKKLATVFLLLAATGIGLKTYLPSPDTASSAYFSIEETSQKKPIENTKLLLLNATTGQQYALQLGLYSDLQQAANMAKNMALAEPVNIITTIDAQTKKWYVMLMGPYSSETEAEKKRMEYSLKASTVRWPINEVSKGA